MYFPAMYMTVIAVRDTASAIRFRSYVLVMHHGIRKDGRRRLRVETAKPKVIKFEKLTEYSAIISEPIRGMQKLRGKEW